jgi:hypothetical protein
MRWPKERRRFTDCLPTGYACDERKQVPLFTNRRRRPTHNRVTECRPEVFI